MDAAFYRAALPEPFRICGVKLRPFSLGHAILFKRFQIPFLDDEGEPTFNDFVTAIILCACRYEEAIEVFQDIKFDRTLRKWMKKLRGIDVNAKVKLFYDYLSEHVDCVPLYSRSENGSPMDAPFEQVVKLTLMSKCGRTETEVLNLPYSLAIWDYLTFKAMEGQVTLLDRDNETQRRNMADKFDLNWRKRNGSHA